MNSTARSLPQPVPPPVSAASKEAFRAEARAWLEENFPKSLKGRAAALLREDGTMLSTPARLNLSTGDDHFQSVLVHENDTNAFGVPRCRRQ